MLVWKAHTGPVYDLAFTPDARHVCTSGADQIVRLWRVGDQTPVREWPGSSFNCPLAVSPSGKYIGRGGWEAKVWPIDSDTPVIEHGDPTESIEAVAFSPDGKVFVAQNDTDSPLFRWKIPGGKNLASGCGDAMRNDDCFATGPLAFSPDGSVLARAFAVENSKGDRCESVVILLNVGGGKELGRLTPANKSAFVSRLAYSPDGTRLAGIYGADLIVWDVAARREVERQKPSKKHFKGLTFTTDGRHLLTASNDAVIQVWAAPTWQPTTTYAWKVGKLGCVAVSPDGTVAAAGGGTGKVVVWDLE
jgi:WD40 repeat protein